MGVVETLYFCYLLFCNINYYKYMMNIKELTIKNNGFAAVYYKGDKHQDAVIIRLGGSGASEDRVIASGKFLIDAGYSVLFLGYYLWEEQGDIIDRIPLDYIETAIKWLKEETNNPNLKIGITAISQGAQYALACASKIKEINALALASPLDYIMEGNTKSFKRTYHSSYTYHGEELPYTAWKILEKNKLELLSKIIIDKNYGISRMLRYGYDKNGFDEKSLIEVEKMHADILLLADKNDDCWPADLAVKRIKQRLKDNHYPYYVEAHIFEKGCHNMGGDMDLTSKNGKKIKRLIKSWSDHPEDCMKCIEDSKKRIIDFFDKRL